MNKEKVVCLMSGGIDTTVLVVKLIEENKEVYGVFFNYGQENKEVTLKHAKKIANEYGINLKTIRIPTDWVQSSILKGQKKDEGITDENIYIKDVKVMSWIPARNNLFMLLAGSYANSVGAEKVYCGFQFDTGEWEIYDKLPDNTKWNFGGSDLTPKFIELVNETTLFNFKKPVKFIAPFIEQKMNCYDVVKLGKGLGVDFDLTYSCRYYPPCGQCEQCIIRKRRLEQ